MGLYSIKCQNCGRPFMWFSGSTNQSCEFCRIDETPTKKPIIIYGDAPKRYARMTITTSSGPVYNVSLEHSDDPSFRPDKPSLWQRIKRFLRLFCNV